MIGEQRLAQLGKYQLVAEIARGGMGIVYLAVSQGPARFSKLLVVKELKPDLVEDGGFLEMFLEEARLAARLSHPNIVQTYEVSSDGKRHFMVMDYLEGVTLARIARRKNPTFTVAMSLRVICEILAALDYAHTLKDFDGTALGIVHRDATPQNVFVTFDGTVKLVDFGIAKSLDSAIETRAGVLKGKPAYMAPEQLGGEVDARADVFAVGVMLWEAVVGHPMWSKKNDVEVLTNIIKGNVPTLREAKPDAPEELIRICDRALAKDREKRYPTAAAFQEALEGYLVSSKTDVSAREVGKVVGEIFINERTTTRTTIEQHLASLKEGKPAEKVPSLRPQAPEMLSTPSGKTPGSLSQADPRGLTPATMTGHAGTPSGTELPARSASISPASNPLVKELARKKRATTIALVVGVVAIGIAATVALRAGDTKTVATEPTPSASAAVSAVTNVPVTHEIKMHVDPPAARISIEGVSVSNPGTRTCTPGEPLTMHASAAHFVSADRTINCTGDETIYLTLAPEPTTEPSASASSAAAPPPPVWRKPAPAVPAPTPTPNEAPTAAPP
jgi:serine/threonine-protein kinase